MENNKDKRPQGELIVYQGQGLENPVQVRLEGDTVWLSQKLMAELYGIGVNTINYHINRFMRMRSCRRRQLFENIE